MIPKEEKQLIERLENYGFEMKYKKKIRSWEISNKLTEKIYAIRGSYRDIIPIGQRLADRLEKGLNEEDENDQPGQDR